VTLGKEKIRETRKGEIMETALLVTSWVLIAFGILDGVLSHIAKKNNDIARYRYHQNRIELTFIQFLLVLILQKLL